MSKDLLKQAERYYAALSNFDYAALEKMFAEDAEYHSSGIGGLYGRPAIIEAMKAYFHEFSDQVSTNDSIEASRPKFRAHPLAASRDDKIFGQKSYAPGR